MQNVKNTIIDCLLGLVAPHLCVSCGQNTGVFCERCNSYIEKQSYGVCWCCSRPSGRSLCRRCREVFDGFFVVGVRRGPLKKLIGALKFQSVRAAGSPLAYLLYRRLPSELGTLAIVPVPTSTAHVRRRGYDHMLLIGRRLARLTGWSLHQAVFTRATHTQHSLGRRSRQVAAKNAYYCPAPTPNSYLIIDDIITTGSTVLAVARALRQAGARTVYVAVVAKQPLD